MNRIQETNRSMDNSVSTEKQEHLHNKPQVLYSLGLILVLLICIAKHFFLTLYHIFGSLGYLDHKNEEYKYLNEIDASW